MHISKEDLNRHIWYEDDYDNIKTFDYVPSIDEVRGMTYHTLFPLEIVEHISSVLDDGTYAPLINCRVSISKGSEDVIIAMVNSGDYTLSEALILWSQCCERCMNVLSYKYLNGEDGYEEYSEEWHKCGTFCKFCNEGE